MKKVMFLSAALVAAAFASCSQDETIDVNNGQGIGFRAFTESQTRAYDVNIDSLKSFTVYALQGTSTTLGDADFVWKDVFNKKGEVNSGTANFTSQTTHYWPSSGTMFFFAYNEDALTSSAQTVTPVINGTTQTLVPVSWDEETMTISYYGNSAAEQLNASGVVYGIRIL